MKSSRQGVSWIKAAMEKAPSSSLMLLYKWILLRVSLHASRSWMALQAATEQPMFLNAIPFKVLWLVSAVAQARIPFSPSALSLRSRFSSFKHSTASHRHLRDFIASSSGRPAITSLKSRSTRVSRQAAKAWAATSAASTPKLLVLSLIFLTALFSAPRIEAKMAFAVSAVTNSLFPSQRSRLSSAPAAFELPSSPRWIASTTWMTRFPAFLA
mmetsp:Transcript_4232/g.12800  ORF Transcript_4232/g.12800 Transcript_4232/m.12800 type:complete len:213 (-) Transcript_4232:293-931(-)